MPKETLVVTYTHKLDIPEDKISEYKEAFDMFDTNHDGLITAKEIYKILKNFGNPVTKQEIDSMIANIDTSGDGQLDFEEFVTLMTQQIEVKEISDEDAVIQAFRNFDKNNDGKITNYEFKVILTQLGDKFSDEELDILFRTCSLDPNGVLDYVEFVNTWKAKENKETKESNENKKNVE